MIWQCTTCGTVNENRHYDRYVTCLYCESTVEWAGDRMFMVAAILVGGSK